MQDLQYHSITLLKTSRCGRNLFRCRVVTLQSRVSVLMSGEQTANHRFDDVSSGCPSEPDNGQRRRHAIVDKYMSSSSATFDIFGALNGVDRRHQSHCRLSMTRRHGVGAERDAASRSRAYRYYKDTMSYMESTRASVPVATLSVALSELTRDERRG